jgi:hypothetical protein
MAAAAAAVRLTEDGKIIKRGKRTYPDGSVYEVRLVYTNNDQ